MGDEKSDPRLEWLESWVALKMSIKPAVFKKMLAGDGGAAVHHFLSNPDCRRVYVIGKDKDNKELVSADLPPPALHSKRKAVYFCKIERQPVTPENIDTTVMVGDLLPNVLTQLHRNCEAAYLPLLAHPDNQHGWPALVMSDLVDGIGRLAALVYVTIGRSHSRTLMPLPPQMPAASAPERMARDKERVHSCETAVATWTRQIKTSLRADPEAPPPGAAVDKSGAPPVLPLYGPLHELEFWGGRAANLASICQQLKSAPVRKVVRVLELSHSNYFNGIARMEADVLAASAEAENVVLYLSTLRADLEGLEQCSPDAFAELPASFAPLLHRCLLVWCHSRHYNTPSRLAVLLRQVGNALVERAREFLDGEALFHLDPPDMLEKVATAIEVCAAFKAAFFEVRDASASRSPENPWKFQNAAVFARLDQFIERCHDLHELATTIVQFGRLERIELGGSKGRALSASVAQMHTDFTRTALTFQNLEYDALDIAVKAFEDDFYQFRTDVKNVERRTAAVLNQGFEDCPTVFSAFKLIDAFEGLLERDALQQDLLRKQAELIIAYAADLKDVQRLFHSQKAKSAEGFYLEREGPPLYTNMPPVAGAIYWVRGLVERVDAPMQKLRGGMARVFELDESREALATHASLLQLLQDFEAQVYTAWAAGVEETAGAKLRLPLMLRDEESGRLSVNFDPDLVRLLREVRYFGYLSTEERPLQVPAAAKELHKDAELFRVLVGNLTLITSKYNQMQATMIAVERPLLEREMAALDALLQQGLTHLTWKSLDVNQFVREALNQVNNSFTKLAALKENLKAINDIIGGWSKAPLMRRKATATYAPKDFEESHKPYLASRYVDVTDGGKAVHKLLIESNGAAKVSKGAPSWKAYVEYVNGLIIEGLGALVGGSLQFLAEQIDAQHVAQHEMLPMLEIQIELAAPEVVFSPRLTSGEGTAAPSAGADTDAAGAEGGGGGGKPLSQLLAGWTADFFKVCKLVKRLDRTDGDFLYDVAEREEVRFRVHELRRHVDASFAATASLLEPFLEHRHLWTANIAEELAAFLRPQPPAPAAANAGASTPASPAIGTAAPAIGTATATAALQLIARMRAEPALAVFEAAVAEKKQKADEVAAMPVVLTRGWLKLDAKPAKQALSTWVTKWMFAYTSHLKETLEECLSCLTAFMADVKEGLDKAEADDEDGLTDADLIAAMGHIHAVNEASEDVEDLFEPLRGTVAILRRYSIPLQDEAIEVLDKAPYAWEDTKKLVTAADERLQSRKAKYAEQIKEEAEAFTADVGAFRAAFREKAPFGYDVPNGSDGAYALLDEWQQKLCEVEARASELRGREILFDVRVHPWREIGTCRTELMQLKVLWDHAVLINNIFESWQSMLWANIDCDACYSFAKRLQAQLVDLEKRIRQAPSWGAYTGTRKSLDEMLTTLPLMTELRDEAMRERHWKKLMRICGKTFVMDAKFCMRDLLRCQLHLFADAVSDIVEQSRQEIKIDKFLQKIDAAWLALQLEYQPFKATGVMVLVEPSLGPVYEALDEHETALQAMMANRFVGFFEVQVGGWKTQLGGVRATLDAWVEVQRQWCSLESIFLGSEDIREQLPEDAKRFDGIDADFKEQMADASQSLSPISACLKEGRAEALQKCEASLALCARSLSDYLETKRRKFPRFYFISAADLVDILSKGRTPPLVQVRFPSDCFWSLLVLAGPF